MKGKNLTPTESVDSVFPFPAREGVKQMHRLVVILSLLIAYLFPEEWMHVSDILLLLFVLTWFGEIEFTFYPKSKEVDDGEAD